MSEHTLNAVDQFRQEVFSLPQLTNMIEVEERARNGDEQAREAIITHCLGRVIRLAYRYQIYLRHDDVGDLISVGNIALVECFEKALTTQRPFAYLCGCAKFQMLKYVARKSDLIRRFDTYLPTIPVLSIEAYPDIEEELTEEIKLPPSYNLLYEALNSLTERQRESIIVRYQLYGCHDVTLIDLAHKRGEKAGVMSYAVKIGIVKMRRYLKGKGESYG